MGFVTGFLVFFDCQSIMDLARQR